MLHHMLQNVRFHYRLLASDNEMREPNQRVPLGLITVRFWTMTCMFCFVLMWSLGLRDARIMTRIPFNSFVPLAYITRLLIALHDNRNERVRVGTTLRRSRRRPGTSFLTFHFNHPAMDDLNFFANLVRPALLEEGAEIIWDANLAGEDYY